MRRLRASSGLRHSCAEGAQSSCCAHRVIPTNRSSESSWSTKCMLTATSFTNLLLIIEKGFRAFRRCLKWHLLHLIPSCCGIVPSRHFWMVLEMVRNIFGRLGSETEINGRTAHANRRDGEVERSIASRGGVHHQRQPCERRDHNSKLRR
jgi:hypothetical protein